ncbi:MAG: hypothetical protein WBM07_10700 [Chitinivibrionales bacterium]
MEIRYNACWPRLTSNGDVGIYGNGESYRLPDIFRRARRLSNDARHDKNVNDGDLDFGLIAPILVGDADG